VDVHKFPFVDRKVKSPSKAKRQQGKLQ